MTIGDVIKQLFTGRYKSIHEFGAELVTSFNNTIAYWGDDENGADVVEKGLCGSVACKFVCECGLAFSECGLSVGPCRLSESACCDPLFVGASGGPQPR